MIKISRKPTCGVVAVLAAALSIGCSSFRDDEYRSPYDSAVDASESDSLLPIPTSKDLSDSIKELTGNGPDLQVAQELFAQGENEYRQATAALNMDPQAGAASMFFDAAASYAGAAGRWPDSALEEDALFRSGESYFFAQRYPSANDMFEQLVKKYPNSQYMDLAQARRFSIAKYWVESHRVDPQSFFEVNLVDGRRPRHDMFGNALRIFNRIPLDDPTGKLADDAMLAAANAHFARRRFMKADQYYTDLRRMFPSSEHQYMAHFLGLNAKLESYQGAQYSGKSLKEAQDLLDQIYKQFPAQSRQDEQELARLSRKVRYLQAERELLMAKYYDRRNEFGAAKLYYDTLLTDYSDTPLADQARVRVTEIAGKPNVPEQRLAWLVNLFPETDSAKPLITTSSLPERR